PVPRILPRRYRPRPGGEPSDRLDGAGDPLHGSAGGGGAWKVGRHSVTCQHLLPAALEVRPTFKASVTIPPCPFSSLSTTSASRWLRFRSARPWKSGGRIWPRMSRGHS